MFRILQLLYNRSNATPVVCETISKQSTSYLLKMVLRIRLLLLGGLLALTTCCFIRQATGQITHPDEVSALGAVHARLQDPYNRLRKWRKGVDPCTNWTGVICNFTQSDGYLHVIELRLLRRNLSGTLAPELGRLTNLKYLNFMFNNISGSIPKEIGNLTSLILLLLSGNQISGPLPDELGYLPNINRFQLDYNNISGPIPPSFANLPLAQHFHMNNNSISGPIPPELWKLPTLEHFLLDNNNLSGHIPEEFSKMLNLEILQLDNNHFDEGSTIPENFTNKLDLHKLSLRNCNLQGPVPDFSTVPQLRVLDLSYNSLTGTIPTNRLCDEITTIDLSHNQLTGTIPANFSGLPRLSNLSLQYNNLTGNVPTDLWQNITFTSKARLMVNLTYNNLTGINGTLNPPPNVTLLLEGNPVCRLKDVLNLISYCGNQTEPSQAPPSSTSDNTCPSANCPLSGGYEILTDSPGGCNCSAPIGVGFLLRSPGISDFPPYFDMFRYYITSSLGLQLYQLQINTPFIWEKGPRLRLLLKFFPPYTDSQFNDTGFRDVVTKIAEYSFDGNDTFGPYDLLNFTLLGPYAKYDDLPDLFGSGSGISKVVLAGIVLGSVACGAIIITAVVFIFYRVRPKKQQDRGPTELAARKVSMKIDGIRGFSFEELRKATRDFDMTSQIGQGGYGKVYRGTLADGTVAAIKRAEHGSIQGEKEFFTEIELLSRLHHRNLVSLIGFCDEQGEQMLVYEYIANGSLRDALFGNARQAHHLNFATRLRIALGSAKGILYLHTEADPPIIHRDIKANNILLDGKFNPKVSDFGISKLFSEAETDGSVSAHVYTYIKGTPGYVDPEYVQTQKLTEKSDVYSLGIVFLELLTGLRPIFHGKHIVHEVLAVCRGGLVFSIVDRSMGPYPAECVKKFMKLSLKCCEEKGHARPTMLEVVRELEDVTGMLPHSDAITPDDLDASGSVTAGSLQSSIHERTSHTTSSDFRGSDLVSGVIPTVRPR